MDNNSRMYFLQIDPGLADTPIESEAIPFSMIVNNQRDEISITKEFNLIDSTLADQNPVNYINSQKFFNCSLNMRSNVEFLNDHYESESQTILRPSESETNCQNNVEISTSSNAVHLHKNKRRKFNGIVHLQDRIVAPRAVAVLPAALYLKGGSVVPRRALPTRVKFGPIQGVHHQTSQAIANQLIKSAVHSKTAIFLTKVDDCFTHIDLSDQDKSNWFSLLPLGEQSTANVWLYQEDNELYGITVNSIAARTALSLGYSKQYADNLGLPPSQPIFDVTKELSEDPGQWWCNECDSAFSTASLLQRHMDVSHKDPRKRRIRRGRFRCRFCDLSYSRFFTLKRHMTLYCCQKTDNIDVNTSQAVAASDTTTLNIDDTRLPSDESLQNFTHGLDFSTSLFDTDRISNLDISGSSKSETEFSPYGIMYNKHESLTANLEFSTNEVDKSLDVAVEPEKENIAHVSFLVSCPHCKQTIVKEKQQQHLSECVERNLKCECGRIFLTKERLAQHILVHHSSSLTSNKNPKSNNAAFKCEKCQLTYMRRGMYVNHMWRVHKTSKVSVPLERRVVHYPCVACPKLYRAASKRDRHVRTHHPGVELVKGSSIEGGTWSCEPAVCPACPRQYVTRAKLLQHLRAAHPDVAPPLQKSIKTKASSQNQPKTTSSPKPTPVFSYF